MPAASTTGVRRRHSIGSGAIPLFTFICAWLFISEEHIDMIKAAGVGLGFLGVLLIARTWSNVGTVDFRGVAYMLAGSMSVGVPSFTPGSLSAR